VTTKVFKYYFENIYNVLVKRYFINNQLSVYYSTVNSMHLEKKN